VKTMFSSFQSIDCSTSKFTVYVKQVIHLWQHFLKIWKIVVFFKLKVK
jgi:hypothetical protein